MTGLKWTWVFLIAVQMPKSEKTNLDCGKFLTKLVLVISVNSDCSLHLSKTEFCNCISSSFLASTKVETFLSENSIIKIIIFLLKSSKKFLRKQPLSLSSSVVCPVWCWNRSVPLGTEKAHCSVYTVCVQCNWFSLISPHYTVYQPVVHPLWGKISHLPTTTSGCPDPLCPFIRLLKGMLFT